MGGAAIQSFFEDLTLKQKGHIFQCHTIVALTAQGFDAPPFPSGSVDDVLVTRRDGFMGRLETKGMFTRQPVGPRGAAKDGWHYRTNVSPALFERGNIAYHFVMGLCTSDQNDFPRFTAGVLPNRILVWLERNELVSRVKKDASRDAYNFRFVLHVSGRTRVFIVGKGQKRQCPYLEVSQYFREDMVRISPDTLNKPTMPRKRDITDNDGMWKKLQQETP